MRKIVQYSLASALVLALATSAQASTLSDPTGDFLASFTGPHNGDLDVVSISVALDGSDFVLTGVMNGAIGTTTGARYIWGVNTGTGVNNFAAIGNPGVLFNNVIALNNDGTGASSGTSLNGNIVISGASITVRAPTSLFPSTGFSLTQYGFNLWPRAVLTATGVTIAGAAQISDFAPDNATLSVPEPASLALMFSGLIGLRGMRRRRTIAHRTV